jgi:hypothetical protein
LETAPMQRPVVMKSRLEPVFASIRYVYLSSYVILIKYSQVFRSDRRWETFTAIA